LTSFMNTRCRQIKSEDIENFVSLSISEALPRHICDPTHIHWKYEGNPAAPSLAIDILDNEQVVGRLWLTYRNFKVNQELMKIGFPQDLLISKQYRNVKAVSQLLNRVFKEAATTADAYFHGSNPISDPIYRTLYRRQPTISLQVVVMPLRPLRSLMTRLMASESRRSTCIKTSRNSLRKAIAQVLRKCCQIQVTESLKHDEEVSILTDFEMANPITLERSIEHREWRTSSRSGFQYTTEWISIRRKPAGYVIWREAEGYGLNLLVIVDIVLTQQLTFAERCAIFLSVSAKTGAHVLLYMGNSRNPAQDALMKFPLVKVPKNLLPQEVHLYFQPGTTITDNSQVQEKFRETYLSLYDLDFY
jgi:hypothetical protein